MVAKKGICGAKTRKGGKCKKKPMKNGRCRYHGGLSTGPPKGSKNALKTGEYESILVDQLEPEEQDLFGKVNVEKKPLIEEELRLVTIRERRMLGLLAGYREQIGELQVVSEETREGVGPEGPVNITSINKEAVETSIIRTEEALTRVQAQKARLIDLLHKMQIEGDDENSPLLALAQSIAGLREERGGTGS